MATSNTRKLNQLERGLPQGFVVDSAWLRSHGYSTSLTSKYVSAGWLEQPASRLYRRPLGPLTWQYVVLSLQTLLSRPLVVGGRTALELHGYAHYLSQGVTEVHLYGPEPPPTWLRQLPLEAVFRYHNSATLFAGSSGVVGEFAVVSLGGAGEWKMTISTPERAVLELLDELPERETFHQADMLMEGLAALSPRRLQGLLEACRSVKTKRLFFFFADRHRHAWLKKLDKSKVDLGSGKRLLVRGGKLDRTYQITVPEDLSGV